MRKRQNKQPNILLLFTDQQRYDTINACGYPHMITPNLDRLVRDGCSFPYAYSPNPVCIPARYSLITGLTARYHGNAQNEESVFNHDLPVLPQILADHGYQTRAIGKMHFTPSRRHHGFDRMELMEEIPLWREDDDYALYLQKNGFGNIQNIHGVRNRLYMSPQRSLIPEEHHGSTWVADRSIEFLKENGGRRPFFLWSSWIAPHPPFDVSDTFADLYRNSELPAPLRSDTRLSPWAQASVRHINLPEGNEADFLRRVRELYYAAISLVDKNIGRVLDALEEINQLDNTLVIFTSDHGEMLGDHNCYQKMLPYDSAARVPFVIRYPQKVQPGTSRSNFVDLKDIMPTILDVSGIKYPGRIKLPGGSVFQASRDRTVQYVEYGRGSHRWISIRDANFKYNYYYDGGREELFDMVRDPAESINLLTAQPDKPITVSTANRLKKRLYEFELKWGLKGYAKNGGFRQVPQLKLNFQKNQQFPVFPDNLADPLERELMHNLEDEAAAAIKNESVYAYTGCERED